MAKFAAVALGVAGVIGDDRTKYDEWKAFYGSNGGEEEFQVFSNNLRIIEQLQQADASASYSHMTPFANISPEDFKTRNGYHATSGATPAPLLDVSSVVSSYDWRDHGAVNPIKDQGQCGSCWAFSTVANIEGVGAVETGKLLDLSEQQLVDCDTSDSGCNGGLPSNAFEYMIKNGMGLEAESAYPYTAADGTCTKSKSQEKAFITAWQQISTDETQIAAAVQQYGPLSIGINANTFQFYSGGVSNPSSLLCNPASLDHGVAIVGFGTADGQDYWTIRNSWGTSWGEAGYIRMVRGTGACGLNTDVTTATGVSTQTLAVSDDRAKYEEWKALYGSNGAEDEFEVFSSNLRVIEQLQQDDASATYSHLSPFANISPEAFKTRNGYRATTGATPAPLLDVSSVATSYDWRDHGAVNPIKDQGQCGSCWAFSTVANVEGAGAVETGKLLNLSEQQLVDCDTSDSGCNGGLPSNAFEYMIKNGMGLEAESAYPYTAADGTCTQSKSQEKAFITAWQQVSTDETQIAAAVQQYGPLSIGINANTFQFYTGGVANPSTLLCNPASLDHGVAIVGFGTADGQDYWTIRNSWGTSWGEAGYIRMVRGTGACGLNTDVTTATGVSTQSLVTV
jgi:cathepsin F